MSTYSWIEIEINCVGSSKGTSNGLFICTTVIISSLVSFTSYKLTNGQSYMFISLLFGLLTTINYYFIQSTVANSS